MKKKVGPKAKTASSEILSVFRVEDSFAEVVSLIQQVAKHLAHTLPGLRGFTRSNLFRMRQFYETNADDKKVSPLVTQLPWTHNLIILGQSKRELEQQFRQALLERTVLHPPKVAPAVRQIHGEAAVGVFKMPMCRFYRAFPILNAVRTELSWMVCWRRGHVREEIE